MDISFFAPLMNKLESMWLGLVKLIPELTLGLFTLLLTWLVASLAQRGLRRILQRSHLRRSLIDFFQVVLRTLIWLLGSLLTITIIFPSMSPAKLLAGLGLGSVAIGLAFKDIFENFLAGAMIMLRKPMRIGDFIECEGITGKVEQITIRDTYIRQVDDQLVLLPNSMLYKNPVRVLTDQDQRMFTLICGVAYDADLDQAASVIAEAVKSVASVDPQQPVQVFAREFNASSIDFTIRWWAGAKPVDMHTSRDQVIRAVKVALDQAGIEIPFPQRTLSFLQPLPLQTDASAEPNAPTGHERN